MSKIDGGCRPTAIVGENSAEAQPVVSRRLVQAGKKQPPNYATKSYRGTVLYIASLKCWCDSQPELCTPCVARQTLARVTGKDVAGIVKWCPSCRTLKPGTAFSANAQRVSGLDDTCKVCAGVRVRAYGQRRRRAA